MTIHYFNMKIDGGLKIANDKWQIVGWKNARARGDRGMMQNIGYGKRRSPKFTMPVGELGELQN